MTDRFLSLPATPDRAEPLPDASPTFRQAGEVITPGAHLLSEREVRHARARANQTHLERLTR